MNKLDKYMCSFCNDAIKALKKYDEEIKQNIMGSEYQLYYSEFPKGIYVRSLTEPILKFILFTKLCNSHKMLPEAYGFYPGKQLLDLAIQSPFIKEESTFNEQRFDIAIEMKWGAIKSDGNQLRWSVSSSIDDILKLHKNCTIENKYFMQFILEEKENLFNSDSMKSQILNAMDRRNFKNKSIEFVCNNSFYTQGFESNEFWKFNILLWKIQ